MGFLSNYVKSFLSKERYFKKVSLFSIWDKTSVISPKTYIAMGVRLSESSIGDYTRVRHFAAVYATSVGKFCRIGKDVKFGVAQHPTNLISTNLMFYRKNQIKNDWVRTIVYEEYKKIKVGNDVWVGEGAMIMGGVTIGDGAIVASRAVVTKDVPPYAIVAGIPARVVKYRFSEEVIEKLLEVQWWNLSDAEIEKALPIFTKPDITVQDLTEYFGK